MWVKVAESLHLRDRPGTPAISENTAEGRQKLSFVDRANLMHSKDLVTSSNTAKDVLVVAWNGMEMLLKKVEGCLDGTLAKAPIAAINIVIDIKNVCCQSQSAVSLLKNCIRRLGTTRVPPKNSSFKPPTDCGSSMRPWTKVFPILESH